MTLLKKAFIAACIAVASVASAEDVYISIGTDGYQTLMRHWMVAKAVQPQATAARISNAGISVLKVNEASLSAISEIMHHHHNRCGGFMVHDTLADAQVDIINGQVSAAGITNLVPYSLTNESVVQALQNEIAEPRIRAMIKHLTGFSNRYYQSNHGVNAAHWLRNRWQSKVANRKDISVELIEHEHWAQPSVMMTITGRSQPDEYVILGAHLDSILVAGITENESAPGADDDASGIATLSEVIETLVDTGFRPNKSVLLIGYAAEEVGLRGSNEIAAAFREQNKNVVGVLQLDMTNYQGSADDIYLIDDYTNARQNDFIEKLIKHYQPELTVARSQCGYACSDHASWTRYGYIASFPFESAFDDANPFIHSPQDTLDKSGGHAFHALKFAKLAVAYVAELAKGNMTDTPDPEPVPEPTTERAETFTAKVAKEEQLRFGPFSSLAGTSIAVNMTGDNDADLYVKRGSEPNAENFDCRPFESGSAESCTIKVDADDDKVYVLVEGYSSTPSTIYLEIIYHANAAAATDTGKSHKTQATVSSGSTLLPTQ